MALAINPSTKILTRTDLQQQVSLWRQQHQTIVFTNGCFDILHAGHIHTLSNAAAEGNKLVVGVNTDRSVSALKGPHRPLNKEQDRALLLSALFMVDAVVLFDEDTPLQLIQLIQPDVLVKGGDYMPEQIVGYREVLERKGRVVVIPFLEGYSTTLLEKKAQTGLEKKQ